MFSRDIGRRVRLSEEIKQDFGFRFLQTQPLGNPLESLGIIRRCIPASGFVAWVRFRNVSSDIGCHPEDLLHVEPAPDLDRFHQPAHIVNVINTAKPNAPRLTTQRDHMGLVRTPITTNLVVRTYMIYFQMHVISCWFARVGF